jgi:hypothetical protein
MRLDGTPTFLKPGRPGVDAPPMSDLSRLLDDLYATSGTATEEPPRAPDWSSQEALDEVFASWVPGPDADAAAAQRSLVAAATTEALIDAPVDDGWLLETEPVVPDEPVVAPTRWSPSDDDILPRRRARRR